MISLRVMQCTVLNRCHVSHILKTGTRSHTMQDLWGKIWNLIFVPWANPHFPHMKGLKVQNKRKYFSWESFWSIVSFPIPSQRRKRFPGTTTQRTSDLRSLGGIGMLWDAVDRKPQGSRAGKETEGREGCCGSSLFPMTVQETCMNFPPPPTPKG